MDPRFYSEGDECEWARVAKVQGKRPSLSVILCESRESRKTLAKHGPPLCSEGDDGEWARVTKVRVSTPFVILCEGGNPERQLAKEATHPRRG